ncbi:BTB/POZ and MATH domain-containing protein 2 [Triticum urartu]|uniref:BTB/POZ and MATH domain-containing protein 2 n=1 Tax=Triticum urartu TaxID=4572 RepID=M7Z5H6_TRIUA|nr:BTB/POZ and MATH domain-containing protein 2 [Triticum urartu]
MTLCLIFIFLYFFIFLLLNFTSFFEIRITGSRLLVAGLMALESKSSSRCTTETAKGTHVLEIVGYSLEKGLGIGKFVQSAIFTVGGYDWTLRFYPDGANISYADCVCVSVSRDLTGKSKGVARASCDLRLVNKDTGLPKSIWYPSQPTPSVFDYNNRVFPECGGSIERSELELEASEYIKDDSLTIECVLTVIKQSQVTKTTGSSEIKVSSSNLSDHFGKLLLEGKGSDVTFSVGGETFAAHKIILAARSPVFEAEMYGGMKEGKAESITVEDMQPAAFKALLHFVYTDSLPDVGDFGGDDYVEMIRHLLVAADRYAMDRLKLICQNILGKNLAMETLATTLALADHHNCDRLKEACIEFIASKDEMDALMATQGYSNLKRTCPSVLIDVFEKASRLRRA